MGFVLLDVTFRVERTFKIRVPRDWARHLGMSWQNSGSDATLDQFHQYVLRLCDEQGVTPPADSWATLVGIVVDASGLDRAEITRETRIIRDIAPGG